MQVVFILVVVALSAFWTGCDRRSNQSSPQETLSEARQGFATKLLRRESVGERVPEPPAQLFRSVVYPAPLGEMAKLDYVDPGRIYLGGHSTGGTLALLVAESSDRFRSVFSFGPIGDIRGYGAENLPFNLSDRREAELRSPLEWLHGIRNPTFVFEGTGPRSNIEELTSLSRAARNPLIHFHPLKRADHFSALAPVSRLIAAKILRDDGPSSNISFTNGELTEALKK